MPASAPFLDLLADAMVAALARDDDPFALSDALVLLPNRRASRGLIDAFAKRLGGAALLPSIRPLGDLDEDAQVWGADPIALDVPPAIEPTRQRMELAALIRARDKAAGGVEDPARALALADELRALIDSAAGGKRSLGSAARPGRRRKSRTSLGGLRELPGDRRTILATAARR